MKKLFKGRRGASIAERLRAHDYGTSDERDQLLGQLAALPNLGIEDVSWTLESRDSAVRTAGQKLLATHRFPKTVEHFIRNWGDLLPVARGAVARLLPQIGPATWQTDLIRFLRHRNDRLRSPAEDILAGMKVDRDMVRLLVPHICEFGADLRRKLMLRFSELGDRSLDELFVAYLGDEDEELRAAAVRVLASRNDPSLLKHFAARLEVETYNVQQALIEALLQFSKAGHDVTSAVLPLLSGGDVGVRQAAMKLLTQMPDQRRVVREFIDYSRTLAGWVRRRALDSMSEFGSHLLEPVTELLNDKDANIRASAVRLVASMRRGEQTERALLPLVRDSDWWVRVNAVETLGDLKSRGSVPTLISLLADRDTRWSAMEALVRIGDRRCIPDVVALLEEPEEGIRVEVVKALARLQAYDAAEALRRHCEQDASEEVRQEALRVLMEFARQGEGVDNTDVLRSLVDSRTGAHVALDSPIVRLLAKAREAGASDVHISVDSVPLMRVRGELRAFQGMKRLGPGETLDLILPILEPRRVKRLEKELSVELCHEIPDMGRYRGSIFLDRKGLNAVFRLIPRTVPTISDIGLPPHLSVMGEWHQGLVLVVGPAGSGKTTTLAALIDLCNETRQSHILTVEDPIEYVHIYKNCLVNQRQIGRDTEAYRNALRGALREDPDIIVLGEMRDADTVRMALEAAETGHLVIGTINGTSAPRAVDRLINAFPPSEQSQVRMMLSDTLKLVIAQSLLPRADGKGRVALFEVLMGLPTVGAVIRENKTVQLDSLMQTGRRLGMRTFDDSLFELLQKEAIAPEVAYMKARNKERFEQVVSADFLDGVLA